MPLSLRARLAVHIVFGLLALVLGFGLLYGSVLVTHTQYLHLCHAVQAADPEVGCDVTPWDRTVRLLP